MSKEKKKYIQGKLLTQQELKKLVGDTPRNATGNALPLVWVVFVSADDGSHNRGWARIDGEWPQLTFWPARDVVGKSLPFDLEWEEWPNQWQAATENMAPVDIEDESGNQLAVYKAVEAVSINHETAIQISNEIGEEFAKGNGDYKAIQKKIERKYGAGALIDSLRTMVAWVVREQDHQAKASGLHPKSASDFDPYRKKS